MAQNSRLPQIGTGRKTLTSYIIGLVLSLILTLIAFQITAQQPMSVPALYVSLAVLAVLQLYAQVVFFLRFNTSPEGQWTLMPFLFTIVIIAALVGGSLWIMYNLNYNMMH